MSRKQYSLNPLLSTSCTQRMCRRLYNVWLELVMSAQSFKLIFFSSNFCQKTLNSCRKSPWVMVSHFAFRRLRHPSLLLQQWLRILGTGGSRLLVLISWHCAFLVPCFSVGCVFSSKQVYACNIDFYKHFFTFFM